MDPRDGIDPGDDGCYRRHEGLAVTRVEDDAFIVDPETQDIFHLNALGRAVWDVLDTPANAAEVIGVLIEAFPDAPPETVRADVLAFLARMEKRGLIAKTH